MSRDLKINILVDDHDAVQKLEHVATAEDHVAASAKQTSVALDETQARFKATSVSTTEADKYLSDFHANLSRMPSTLSLARSGLNGLAEGLGVTVESLGAFGAAGLVVGTAIGAWRLGRVAADFLDLDAAISRSAATLLGWGNDAAQTAAAQADVLARASDNAGREITNLTEAMQINAQHADEEAIRLQAVANGAKLAEQASKALRDELVAYLTREQVRWDAEDRAIQQKIKRDAEELGGFRDKIHEIEFGGAHAYSTLHQWYGELHRDQQRVNDLADQNIQKFVAAQHAAEQFLAEALAAAQAIDAELAASPIGHGPTVPNAGSSLNPSPISVRPIGPIVPPSGVVGGQNTNTTLRTFADGGPTGPGGLAILHPNEFVVPQGGALVKSGGSTIVINIDAKGATFEDDRSLNRLVDKITTRIGVVAGQRGATR